MIRNMNPLESPRYESISRDRRIGAASPMEASNVPDDKQRTRHCSIIALIVVSYKSYRHSLVSLHEHHRTHVNMPTPYCVINNSKQHYATVHRNRPVHIDSRDRLLERPK
jgi:hypothetical protein